MIFWLSLLFPALLSAAELPLQAPEAAADISTGSLSLDSVEDLAQRDNPELAAARQEWLAAAEVPNQAAAFDDPSFSVSHMLTGMRTAPQTQSGPMMDQFTVTQNIPFWGKRGLRGQAASMGAEIAGQAFRAKSLEIRAEAVRAYCELYFLDETVDILDEQQSVLNRLARSASARYASGQAPEVEALKAAVELAKIENDLVTAQEEARSATARLNVILDRPPLAPLGKPQTPLPREFKWNEEALGEDALAQRPEIMSLEASKNLDEAQRRLAIKRYFPDFTLGYEYAQLGNGSDLSYNGQAAQSLMVGLNLPIWLGKNRAAVRQSRADLAASAFSLENMTEQTRYQVVDLSVKAETAARLFKLYQDTVLPQARAALDSAQSAYEAGKMDFLDMLDSERALLSFELEQERHRADFEIDLADLERVLGGPLPLTQGAKQ